MRGLVIANVVARNSDFALNYLMNEGVNIAGQDLLGNYYRKVYYFPSTGRVLGKKIRTTHNETIIEREQAYTDRLKAADIELF